MAQGWFLNRRGQAAQRSRINQRAGRVLAVIPAALLAFVGLVQAAPQAASTTTADTGTVTGFVNKYCVTCHNERLKTAGFALNPADLADVANKAETWEKVVRKLRGQSMPPAGAPRPDQQSYESVAGFLEKQLDTAALAHPEPGKLPLLHRLSRTEYQNAIRDLLGVDKLPKEMDYSLLLPPDNASSGFDNLADLLFVSPTSMERYLAAARKISRIAIGDPNIPEMVNIYPLPGDLPQDSHVEGLPFGTRGGIKIDTEIPLDGTYMFRIEFASAAREPHQIEINVDGQRVWLTTVGNNAAAPGGFPRREPMLEPKVPLTAGPHVIGVTFVQHNEARDEETVRPRLRGRGTQPSMAQVTLAGPYDVKGPGDTPSRRLILTCKPATAAAELPCAKKILSTLAKRAYRRPVNDTDLEDLLPFYESGRKEGSFEAGIQRSVERLLVSPQFMFRIERIPANVTAGNPFRITDLELASRLSFFLWSSIPDDELINVAAAGKLKDPAIMAQQVRRMLADPKAETLVTNFAEQWLYLRDVEAKKPDELLFPDFDQTLRDSLRTETRLFLDSVLRSDKNVLELLTANYTFLNERLAWHYGIPNIKGSYFRRVEFPEGSVRAGLLTQGSILTLTAYANRTSPVLRGKWIMENILSSPPPPPPPNVPALKTENTSGKPLTMREAMIAHRAAPACASCHSRMDPIGFAMENFDAIGRWRDADNGTPIDASGVLLDGSQFKGLAGLRQALLKHPDQFVGTISEKLLMYALSRNLQYYDMPVVRKIVHEAGAKNNTFAALVTAVAQSDPFQMRVAPAKPAVNTASAK
jgi:mono/diheme cytochrome c family protein